MTRDAGEAEVMREPDNPIGVAARRPAACHRPAVVIWIVVNLVCVLQSLGYLTRPWGWAVQRTAGLVIMGLAVPATWALVRFISLRAGARFYVGPIVFDAFVVMLAVVDYWLGVDWRSRSALQAPMLVLFFGSIIAMGAPMFRIDRRKWAVTAASASLLTFTMLFAIATGVG